MRERVVAAVKKVVPPSFVHWVRRQRAAYRYMGALGEELYERHTRLDLENLEDRVVDGHPGFYERVTKELLERTELVLQELDRKIEGVAARQGGDLRDLKREVEAIKARLDEIEAASTKAAGRTARTANG